MRSFQRVLQTGSFLNLIFRGDGKTAAVAKRLSRNLYSRRGLLALVFVAVYHTNDFTHQFDVNPMILRNLLGAVHFLNVVFENGIVYLVGWKSIRISLIGSQLRRQRSCDPIKEIRILFHPTRYSIPFSKTTLRKCTAPSRLRRIIGLTSNWCVKSFAW